MQKGEGDGGERTVRNDERADSSQYKGKHESHKREKQSQPETFTGDHSAGAVAGRRYDDAQQPGDEG